MIELPLDIHALIHDYLKIPKSHHSITTLKIKESYVNHINLKTILYHKTQNKTFIDEYTKDLHALFTLIKKYSYYETQYKMNEPISSILIDLLCTGCTLPYAESTYSVFTENTFDDLKEIIRIVPDSLHSQSGQLRCRHLLSPLDIACHNRNIPLYVIKYMVENGADMYHFYEVNEYKTHVLQEMNRSETITHIYISNGFVMKQMQEQLAVWHKRYK